MTTGLSSEHTRWGETLPRTSWFDVRELEPGVHLVSEPYHVNSFLVQGRNSAVLLDTGLGVANVRAVAEELTDKPLLVVNSHYHFDHTGGNPLFDEIAIHRLGAPLLERPAPDGWPKATWRIRSDFLRRTSRGVGPAEVCGIDGPAGQPA